MPDCRAAWHIAASKVARINPSCAASGYAQAVTFDDHENGIGAAFIGQTPGEGYRSIDNHRHLSASEPLFLLGCEADFHCV
jgi:hypothetical protein